MSEVTAPIMTDATGQSIDSKLNSLLGKMDNLAAAFQPNASGIVYSNSTSGLTGDDVQEAIDEVAADITEINTNLTDLNGKTVKTTEISKSVTLNANSAVSTTISIPAATQSLIGTIIGFSVTCEYAGHIITEVGDYDKTQFTIGVRSFWNAQLTATVTIKIMYTTD